MGVELLPEMHTSMSSAMLLLARREKSRFFRWTMTIYCSLIIFSTLYLKIHWVLDVFAGMIFAWLIVKLTDLSMKGLVYLPTVWHKQNESKGHSL